MCVIDQEKAAFLEQSHTEIHAYFQVFKFEFSYDFSFRMEMVATMLNLKLFLKTQNL